MCNPDKMELIIAIGMPMMMAGSILLGYVFGVRSRISRKDRLPPFSPYGGYQPEKNNLDKSKPPRGGSGLCQ